MLHLKIRPALISHLAFYEPGALENKEGKKLPSTLKTKINKLDSKSRKRVEKAREEAIRQAADPAIMVTDVTLLLDVTIMLSFAAFGGFLMKACRHFTMLMNAVRNF